MPWRRSPGRAGEIHDWCCQGLTGCPARIRSTDDTERWRPSPALMISASNVVGTATIIPSAESIVRVVALYDRDEPSVVRAQTSWTFHHAF
jgi:hypothetical protein